MTAAQRRSRRLAQVLAAITAVSLGLGGFVVYGARVTHPVDLADARARYADRPTLITAATAYDDRPAGPRPEPGVYAYETTGSARIDRLGVDRAYPATSYRIVRLGAGCLWQEEVALLSEHVETYDVCADDGDQLDVGYGTRLTYFFVPGTSTATCAIGGTRTAPGKVRGESVTYDCVDAAGGVRSTVTTTFLDATEVTVDGVAVPCRSVRVITVLSGRTEGVAVRELCTEPTTGLVLREKRDVGLSLRSSFIGRIRYVESAEFTLRSLVPTP